MCVRRMRTSGDGAAAAVALGRSGQAGPDSRRSAANRERIMELI